MEGTYQTGWTASGRVAYSGGMNSINVLNTTLGVIIGVFLLRVLQGLTSKSSNPIAQGVSGGITYLLG
jgi:hypothetical protein